MKNILSFTCACLVLLSSFQGDDKEYKTVPEKPTVDKSSLLFDNQKKEDQLTFKITHEGTWEIVYDTKAWIKIDKPKGKGDTEITVTALPNNSKDERLLNLVITSVNNKMDYVTVSVRQVDEVINVLDQVKDEYFRDYLIKNISNGKNNITLKDAQRVTHLDLSDSRYITSLEGIHFFSELEVLNCSENKITSLDISKNIKLSSLNCSKNEIETLDVSKNKLLTDLKCSNNNLRVLDLKQRAKGNRLLPQLFGKT